MCVDQSLADYKFEKKCIETRNAGQTMQILWISTFQEGNYHLNIPILINCQYTFENEGFGRCFVEYFLFCRPTNHEPSRQKK